MAKKYTLRYPEKEPNKKRKLTFHERGSSWWPCHGSVPYKENYDKIKWRKQDAS